MNILKKKSFWSLNSNVFKVKKKRKVSQILVPALKDNPMKQVANINDEAKQTKSSKLIFR